MKKISAILLAYSLFNVACQHMTTSRSPASNPSRYCIVDMGSRSTKLLVAKVNDGKLERLFPERSTPASEYKASISFGQDVEKTGRFSEQSLKALEKALAKMQDKCNEVIGAKENLYVIATAAARDAHDETKAALKQIVSNMNGSLEIFSKEREAQVGFIAASNGEAGAVVMDFGSRSFQLSQMKEDQKVHGVSFNLGHQLSFEKFYKDKSYSDGLRAHSQDLEKVKQDIVKFRSQGRFKMMGGSKILAIVHATNLGAIEANLAKGPVTLRLSDLKAKMSQFEKHSQENLSKILRDLEESTGVLESDRTKYISGLMTLKFILESQGRESIDVVEGSLADGYALILN